MNEAGSDVTPRKAPNLAPGEIAYRDFGHEPDGLAEREVRSFLGEVAEAIAAGRERERRLEQRVRGLEGQLVELGAMSEEDITDPSDPPPDERVGELFAELRHHAATPPPADPDPKATAQTGRAHAKRSPPETPEPDPERATADAPTERRSDPHLATADDGATPGADDANPPTGDDLLRSRCDAIIGPLATGLLRVTKRLLQDEQNVLLDAARRARSRVDPAKLLPDPGHHREAWAAALAPALDLAYGGGRTSVSPARRAARAPDRVVNEIAAALITPLRERLTTTIAAVMARGPYESTAELHRELAAAIGARYREWRTADIEIRLDDALAAAYARGTYDGAPAGAELRWVTYSGDRCPDCDDNGLEPTVKGRPFPTGQAHPPAHPGCRCFLVVEPATATPSVRMSE